MVEQQGASSRARQSALCLAVETDQIRAGLVETIGQEHRLVGWITVARDQHQALSGQVAAACRRMGARLGRDIWDPAEHRPLREPLNDMPLPPIDTITAVARPRPRLRVWVAGLSQQASVKAARQAIRATHAEVVGESVLNVDLSAGSLARSLAVRGAEVLVIAGGYDDRESSTQRHLLALCTIVGQAAGQLPRDLRPVLIFAGNRWAAEEATAQISQDGGRQIQVTANVQPNPNSLRLNDLARTLQAEDWRRSRAMLGIAALEQWITKPARLMAVDWSFAQLVRVWMDQHGMSELHGVCRTSEFQQHVWAHRGQESVRMIYVDPDCSLTNLDRWPSPQLLCGPVAPTTPLPPTLRWWDRSGMAPMIATLGQVTPLAMVQVLQRDIFGV